MPVPGVVVTALRRRLVAQYAESHRGQPREATAIVGNLRSALQIGRSPESGQIAAIPQSRTDELRGLRDDQRPGGD